MTNPSLRETLRKMASDHESRSESARLREVYADVERALDSGVSRKAVLDALHADGFTMSLKMFDKALYRIRNKNRVATTYTPDADKTGVSVPGDPPQNDSPPPTTQSPMTPGDFRRIRNQDIDTRQLSQPVKRQNQ